MLTNPLLQCAAGGVLRLALNLGLSRRFALTLSLPQVLAGTLLVLAGLPDFLKPLPYPLSLWLTLGLVLPDLILRRRG